MPHPWTLQLFSHYTGLSTFGQPRSMQPNSHFYDSSPRREAGLLPRAAHRRRLRQCPQSHGYDGRTLMYHRVAVTAPVAPADRHDRGRSAA